VIRKVVAGVGAVILRGTGQSSLVRAALGVDSPPGPKSSTNSAGAGSGAAGSGLSSAGQLNRVVGSLTSIGRTSLTLQTFQGGTQSVAVTPQTRFYKTVTGSISDLTPGEHVTVRASGSTQKPVASSITVGPAQLVSAGGGGRFGGGGGFGGAGGVPLRTISGTLTSVAADSIGVTGSSSAVSVTSSTRISRLAAIKASQLPSGSFVTVQIGTVQGRQVAIAVLARSSAFRGGGFGSSGSGG
jgi:hypothetical protein